jgi:hypothetical protein
LVSRAVLLHGIYPHADLGSLRKAYRPRRCQRPETQDGIVWSPDPREQRLQGRNPEQSRHGRFRKLMNLDESDPDQMTKPADAIDHHVIQRLTGIERDAHDVIVHIRHQAQIQKSVGAELRSDACDAIECLSITHIRLDPIAADNLKRSIGDRRLPRRGTAGNAHEPQHACHHHGWRRNTPSHRHVQLCTAAHLMGCFR